MSLIVTLTGPSCAGKSTLEKALKAEGFENVVSTTTRPMREGEVDGLNYHFISKSEYKRLDALGAFVESVMFGGNYYGVTVAEINRVMETGKPIVIVVEPHGLMQIKGYAAKAGWRIYPVFVDNPLSVIGERFLRRFAEEVSFAPDPEVERKIKTYAGRLAAMSVDEMHWRNDAYNVKGLYSLVLPTFNEGNFELIVQALKNQAALHDIKKAACAGS